MTRVRVLGGGVAALCCARLLAGRGASVRVEAQVPTQSPTLVVNAVTAELIERVFGTRRRLFADAWPTRARSVRWGPDAEIAVVPEPALAIRESDLIQRLAAGLGDAGGADVEVVEAEGLARAADGAGTDGHWIVAAAGRAREASRPRDRFGRRQMIAAECVLSARADATCAWIETTPEGWIFLGPTGPSTGIVQAMVPAPAREPDAQITRMVAGTRELRARIAAIAGPARTFSAAPSLVLAPARAGFVAVGDEACSFDPLCGDGLGYAVRGAILAAAVIGGDAGGLAARLAHYEARLITAVMHHARACRDLYRRAGLDASWDDEQRAIDAAPTALEARRGEWGEFRLGLRGLDLAPLSAPRA